MDVLNLAVILESGETRIAKDIFSGKLKTLVLPYYFPHADAERFLLVVKGETPGVGLVKVSDSPSYASLENLLRNAAADGLADYAPMLRKEHDENSEVSRICTIIKIGKVTPIPMNSAEVQHSSYLQGDLTEEGDTEGLSKEMKNKGA